MHIRISPKAWELAERRSNFEIKEVVTSNQIEDMQRSIEVLKVIRSDMEILLRDCRESLEEGAHIARSKKYFALQIKLLPNKLNELQKEIDAAQLQLARLRRAYLKQNAE